MKRYVLDSNNKVANVIELEDDSTWVPPEGLVLVAKDYVPIVPVVPVKTDSEDDYKTLYTEASTEAEKLDVIAKALGLKD